jgi:hypothetical protein
MRSALLTVLLMACSGGDQASDAGPTDGGPGDAGLDAAEPPAAPEPPEGPPPVDLSPCPEGWQRADDAGVVTCLPWVSDVVCAKDAAHFPGEADCRRIGSECPAGEWPDDLPDGASVLYVRADEPAGGTGTMQAPLGRIADAMDLARPGDVVALARGVFDEIVDVPEGVTLWGACVAETGIESSATSDEDADATVLVRAADVVLGNLRVGGPRQGIRVRSGSVELQGVLISGAAKSALLVAEGGTVSGSDVVVRDTRGRSDDGLYGFGIEVRARAEAALTGVVVEACRDVGVYVAGTLALDRAVIRDTVADDRGSGGVGLLVDEGGRATVSVALVERSSTAGVSALARSDLALTDVVVRGTQPRPIDGMLGRGIEVGGPASVTATRVLVSDNMEAGVILFDAASVTIAGAVISGTRPEQASADYGGGVEVVGGSDLVLRGVLVLDNRDVGIAAWDDGTSVDLEDVTVRGTRSERSNAYGGDGVVAQGGARVEASRLLVEGNRSRGIAAWSGSRLALTDVEVRDTASAEADLRRGRGLEVTAGSEAVLTRVTLRGNREVSAIAGGDGSRIDGSDVAIVGTLPAECVDTLCPLRAGGVGLAAVGGAAVDLAGFAITGSAECGVLVGRGATIDLHLGLVADNAIGISVLDESFDPGRLADEVLYQGNTAETGVVASPAY